MQLPAWNEALGLPRPCDQQWSLRMQQIMAYETDLLEYGDLFDGNPAVEAKVEALKDGARAELARIDAMGGAVAAIDYMKSALVAANTARLGRIEAGETVVVGVNRFTEAEPSPLTAGDDGILVVDPAVEAEQVARLAAWRDARDAGAVAAALAELRAAAAAGGNVMPASIAAAKAGATTGEWGAVHARGLRRVPRPDRRRQGGERAAPATSPRSAPPSRRPARRLGRRIKFLVGKPGLDGHSNGAEQIAVRARDSGMEVVYEGIRLTPAADRQRRARGVGARRRPVDPLRLAPAAGHRGDGADARGRARATSRSSSAASSPTPTPRRCSPPASPASTRRRTSSSTASCSTSSPSPTQERAKLHDPRTDRRSAACRHVGIRPRCRGRWQ